MHATMWMNLKNITLRERSQMQKTTWYLIPHHIFGLSRILQSIEELVVALGWDVGEKRRTVNACGFLLGVLTG